MVVGRRRVAAASVATAYALHIYVLPQHRFRSPRPAIPSLSPHTPFPSPYPPPPPRPGCRKVGVCIRVTDIFRGCWCRASLLSGRALARPSISLLLSQLGLFLSKSTTTLLALKSSYTYAGPHRAKSPISSPSFVQLYPRLSIHCSRVLLLLRLYLFRSYQLLACLGISQCPIPELK